MSLSAEIIIREDAENLKKLFKAEEKVFKNKRASYQVIKKGGSVIFSAKAEDASALRAVLNSITKLISVYEKAGRIVKE